VCSSLDTALLSMNKRKARRMLEFIAMRAWIQTIIIGLHGAIAQIHASNCVYLFSSILLITAKAKEKMSHLSVESNHFN
jgi:hypothetical protein